MAHSSQRDLRARDLKTLHLWRVASTKSSRAKAPIGLDGEVGRVLRSSFGGLRGT